MSCSRSLLVVHNFDTFEVSWSEILQSVLPFGLGCCFLVTTLRLYIFGKNAVEVLLPSHCFVDEGLVLFQQWSEATACAEGLRETLHLLESGWWVPERQALSRTALSMLLLPDFPLLGYQASNAEVRFLLCRQTAPVFVFLLNSALLRPAEKTRCGQQRQSIVDSRGKRGVGRGGPRASVGRGTALQSSEAMHGFIRALYVLRMRPGHLNGWEAC